MSYPLVHHIMQHKGFTKNKDVCTAELKELHSWLKSASNSECLETLPSILISSEECLSHTDRKIRLLLACCLTQVLRIFDQNQPFSSVQNLEIALIFILSQLAQGLQSLDTEEQALSLQLLQYLINIKGFRSTRLIKNGHEILSSMLSVMIPIAEQASVSQRNLILQLIKEVLDDPMMMMEPKVLMPIAESIVIGPHSNLGTVLTLRGVEKPSGKAMTELLKYLLENTDPGTRNVTEDKVIPHSLRNIGVFVLVQKLYSINRKLVQPIYPVLAMRLKSLNCDERKECLNVVSNLLIHDDANADHPLFSPFLDRSSDVDVNIRLQTIHAICHLVQVLPKCATKIINTLHRRTSDPDVVLRCELAAVCTQIMLQNDSALELLLSLRTLSNDEEIKIQMEAICGMVKVYERHLTDHTNLSESNRDYAHIIFNTLMSQHLHTEISTSNHIVENLLYTYIFPNTQSVPKYTEKLLFFLCGANAEAIKKIQFIHEIQKRRKEAVLKWISQRKEERITNRNTPFSIEHVEEVSPYFPDDGTKIWCLKALDFVLAVNENCYTSFTTILEENYGTEADTDVVMSQLIDIASLVYSECTIQIPKLRQLLSSLYKGKIATEHVQVIIQTMEKCLRDPSSCFCYGLNPQTVFQQLANVLKALVEPYGDLFINREELAPLLVFLSPKNDLELISTALKIFSVLGAEKSEFTQSSLPLESRNPELAHCIKNSCEILLFGKEHITLSTSLLKQIINFIHNNLPLSADTILTNYFLMAKEKLEESPKFSYSAYIALLGYLSPWLPLEHRNVLKSTISRKVVKDLLMKSSSTKESLEVTRLKCSTTNLSAEVFCKMLGMKTIYRWLLSTQGEDLIVIGNTLRMLDAFLVHKGDLLDAGDLSDPERAALRLTAGRCILKICGSENALKQLNPNQIHNLSQLMMDENAEVREKFGSKLYKDLCQGKGSLSSLFLSFLALGVLDPEEHLQQKAMQHIEQFCQSKGQEWDALCLFWLIPLLANAPGQWIVPRDKDSMLGWHPNVSAQQRIRLAMWSIIAPILSPQPNITVARIRHIVQKIKNSEDGMSLDCNSNVRIWVTCDLVTGLLDKYKCTVLKSIVQVDEVFDLSFQLPYHLLRPVDNPDYQNSKVYTNLLFGELPTLPRTQFNSSRIRLHCF